jgi:DNA-binding Lrp family transcriptional regulator
VPSSSSCSGTAGSRTSTLPTRCGSLRRRACGASRPWRPTGLTVFVGLKIEGHSRETSSRIEQALLAIPSVVACHVVSGADDFLVEAAVPDLASYERVLLDQLLAIPSVTEARSTFAIRTVLSRGPLPLDHWK